MTSREPRTHWATLLVSEPECEAWKATTTKWAKIDRVRQRQFARSASAPGDVAARSADCKARTRNYFRSSYQVDFCRPAHTMNESNGAVAVASVHHEDQRLRLPDMALVRDRKTEEVSWKILRDVDRVRRQHSHNAGHSGALRPHPHVTAMCDTAARSRIALFGGSVNS
mmetsp:Transcript_4175/g.10034  ORF Transcript_4175/g.10034 Transcript_4175/m.10034 type:complete len:169 (-) Transcript_4175:33-539(-)